MLNSSSEPNSKRPLGQIRRRAGERDLVEQELKRARRFLQTVIDGLGEEVTGINRDFTITLTNRKSP